jgi:hypothetical protein
MTPDDVYALVLQQSKKTQDLVGFLCFLVVVLLLIVTPASLLFLWDFQARRKQYAQNKKILDRAVREGEITDNQHARMRLIAQDEFRHLVDLKNKVKETADEVKKEVVEVKDKVTEAAKTITRVDEKLPDDPSKVLLPRDPNARDRVNDRPSGEFKP